MMGEARSCTLEDILTEKQIHHILNQTIGKDVPWNLKSSEVRPAADGIAGFLGDHKKAVLNVDVEGEENKVHLFIKRVPIGNEDKATFITECNFYEREGLMYILMEEICDDSPNPWCVKAYVYTDSIFVMPDLSVQVYTIRHYIDTLDINHVLLTASSLARFHAAVMNYETDKSIELDSDNVNREYGHLLTDPLFGDTPWLRAGPKVSVKLLEKISKLYNNIPDLEAKLSKLFRQACDLVREQKGTVNTLIHKDLWVNNVMFKYEENVPVSAVLLDFQGLRYVTPHLFLICLRLVVLGYDKENFLEWVEKARMFAVVQGQLSSAMVLMDPKTAEKTFDDPETSAKHFSEDRSELVVAHTTECESYRNRLLEVAEEFVEDYVLK